jgi:regulator of sigma E protease
MKGEAEYQAAVSAPGLEIPRSEGTFFGASPWRRVIVSAAGPFANVVFAVFVFIAIWGAGFEIRSLDNRIVLASDINSGERYAADEAGLKTGDRIIEINGRPIGNYFDIQEAIAPRGDMPTALKIRRGERVEEITLIPRLDKTGSGKLGVYYWADPVIAAVAEGSPAHIGALKQGDRILKVNGQEIPYTMALIPILRDNPPLLELEYERAGVIQNTGLVLSYNESGSADIGIEFETLSYPIPGLPPHRAILKGLDETWKTLTLSLRSLTLLFNRNIDLTQAVSGPVRITYMVGDVAAQGFGQGVREGLISMGNFLALISIALCIMNLLPIPVLDGGMIALFILEGIIRRPIKARTIYIFQTVGVVLIFGLMIFAVFGDILFLAGRR